jgi:succinyl-CoA synthetase alpha subunit
MTSIPGRETQILVQGITGREARMFTAESRAYGAAIVAGVTPGRGGTTVDDTPVYDTVASACAEHRLDATLVSVPPGAAADAALEAISARIPLVVITTERVPLRDTACVCERANAAGVRVIGPNSLGVIVPGETRIGSAGGSASQARRWYTPGHVAVLSRSGGMMTEIAAMLTGAGIGQRVCISVGGDMLVGSSLSELYALVAADPETHAVVVFGEPGGTQEEDLAALLAEKPSVPVVAFIAGGFTDRLQGVRFGHAGSIVHGATGSPRVKRECLGAAGAYIATRLDELPELVRGALAGDLPLAEASGAAGDSRPSRGLVIEARSPAATKTRGASRRTPHPD